MTAPPPLPSAGRADRARRAASTVDPSNPIRPGPRSCPRRAGHGQRPRPRTREPNGPRRCMWAISVPCALPDRIMRMGQWATCRTDHAAHAKAHVRAGIADHPDGPWTVQGMVPRTTLTDHGPFGGPTKCVCSIESGPCERVDVFHVSGRFWSTSACGEKRTPARPAWTSFPS